MKDFKIYIIIASVLLVLYLVILYNRPKPINWTETLSSKDKIPYGTYILYHQLHNIFPRADIRAVSEPVYHVIAGAPHVQHSTYMIICNTIDLTEGDYGKLVQFLNQGNDVFISANSFGAEFSKQLKVETSSQLLFGNRPRDLRFLNKTLSQTTIYTADQNLTLGYFSNLDTSRAVALGEDGAGNLNFVKYNLGKGSLYLNTNPLMFTNYSLLENQGAEYTAVLLSHLNNHQNLIWDDYYTAVKEASLSPMRVFLNNNALRAAFYIAVFSLVLFVIYQMKRRQRIIPVIAPLNNTTVDFVNVVGQVYYEQRNNSNIAQKQVTYFLEHLRTSYYLKTTVLNDEFATALSQKTGVEINLIQKLINQIALVRTGSSISDNDLIELNKSIEQFYIQSR